VEAGLVFENNEISVESIPLRHGVPTVGYIFREKPRPLNIRPEKISEFQLSIPQIKEAKAGGNIVLANGQVIENEEITLPSVPLRSYGFLTDTVCDEVNLPYLEGLTMLYHDTTFCDDHADNASLTMHSTVKQAAALAKKAKVGRLLTGHYSSRYRDLSIFLEEAQSVFPDTVLGQEGVTYQI
jgi:ribonuclease Z